MFEGKSDIEKVLITLAEHLQALDAGKIELVVCGGAALNILNHIIHRTEDIDVIAHIEKDKQLSKGLPKDPMLDKAIKKVQKDFNLNKHWLNERPEFIVDLGLPKGFMKRVKTEHYGSNLIVHFISRFDQICFKLYAAVDEFGGKHLDNLKDLHPTKDELIEAAQWCISASPARGYKKIILDFLIKIGNQDVARRL